MRVEAYADHAARHWPAIEAKLREGTYQPGAVRGVSIPKPQGGQRLLGIPNVQDRVIMKYLPVFHPAGQPSAVQIRSRRICQQALLQVLSPIFEEEFSPHSYGYRPGRSAHDAVRAAQA